MRDQRRSGAAMWTPGIWSTDDYIRQWAGRQLPDAQECIVPLQSLHGSWVARVRLALDGQPVERLPAEALEEHALNEAQVTAVA